MGLVSSVTPDETFLDTVLETAAGIAATAPVASRLTKVALRDGGHADFETAVEWEALAQPVTLATEDLQEGVRAAAEKRPAAVQRPLSARREAAQRKEAPGRTDASLAFPLRVMLRADRGPRLRRN